MRSRKKAMGGMGHGWTSPAKAKAEVKARRRRVRGAFMGEVDWLCQRRTIRRV